MTEPSEPTTQEIREKLQAFYEATASYQSRMLEASSGYNQVVVLAGYAGFFTIWSAMRADVPHWLLLTSGALMAVSLIVYVSWTVYGMLIWSRSMRRLLNEIAKGPEGYLERVQTAEAKNVGNVATYTKFWKPALWGSGLPGFIAGALIAAGAFAAVLQPTNACSEVRNQGPAVSKRAANLKSRIPEWRHINPIAAVLLLKLNTKLIQ